MVRETQIWIAKISKRRLVTILILLSLMPLCMVFPQDIAIDFGKAKTGVTIKEDSFDHLSITLQFEGITSFHVSTVKGDFNEIGIPGLYSIGRLGTPKLPAVKKLIEIPHGAEFSVEIKNYSVKEYKLSDYDIIYPIMPVQPSIRKDQNSEDIPFEFDENIYQSDGFLEPQLATLEELGILRGIRLARLTIAPVSYNPVKGVVKVVNDVEVEITFRNTDPALHQYIKASTYSPYFDVVQNTMLNRLEHSYPAHPDLTKYPVKYLIVSPRMFENDLQPFIQWKTKKGFKVITGYTDQIGTSYSAIRSWVQSQYNSGTPTDPAPSFLLIVGDTPQIPSTTGSASGKMTDLYYGSVDGDYFPDMYYGRFSATNSAQLVAQINKTIYYEKYQFADPTYLNNITLIAGADSYWNPKIGQPCILYGTTNYFNTAHGYNAINVYLNSYSGCYDPSRIAVSLINYTAHCSETSWGDPMLSKSMVNSFVNIGKYPVAIGNCCLSANFGTSECIGETWQRAANKGSVAYIGSSPSSYWFEDFYWSVGAFPIQGYNNGYVPTYAETTWGAYDAPFVSDYVTTGSMVFVGNLAVTEVHIQGYPSHSSPLYYWQAYNVLGDPSLVPFYTQPDPNTVTHTPFFPIGLDTYEVNALPGSYVAISKDNVLHGAGLVGVNGVAQIMINPVLSAGMVDIVVTKPQHIPYITQVPAAALQGPYIVLESFTINDESGNNNGKADYDEDIWLNLTFKNIGADPSSDLTVTISGDDDYTTITSLPSQSFQSIPNGEMFTLNNAFSIKISSYLPDQHLSNFQLQITDGNSDWNTSFKITLNAPQLEIVDLTIDDQTNGNGNGHLDPGETINLNFTLSNNGGADAKNVNALLTFDPSIFNIGSEIIMPGNIGSGEQKEWFVIINVLQNAPTGIFTHLHLMLTTGQYSELKTFDLTLGVDNNIEDFESGDFSMFPWQFSGNANWTITNVSPYEGNFCAKSGAISHNKTSVMQVTVINLLPGEMSFWHKVSSETNYDFLRFYIDGVQKDTWSGNTSWQQATYPITAGQHTYKWAYTKDISVNSGSDCAWVDLITFPINATAGALEVNIQANQTIIEAGDFIQFYDISSGFPLNFNWNFEGGIPATSTNKNPMITYEQPGNYNVSLTISNANGQASKTFENYIVVTSSIISQTLYIPAGWSGISSNLIPQNTIVGNILQPILNDLIVLQNMNGVFYPEMGINTIGLWDYKQGYKIKTNAETQLNITGWQNEQQTLDLIAGWNLIPIMSNLNQNIELLFSGLPQNGLLVKEVAGTSLYWPEMNINTLLELEPGKAYFVKIVNPATIYFMNDPLK